MKGIKLSSVYLYYPNKWRVLKTEKSLENYSRRHFL